MAVFDTLHDAEMLNSTNPGNALSTISQGWTTLSGMLEKPKSAREVLKKSCDVWLKAWDAADGNGKDGKTA
ncbi:uncharacterized protein PpBr36_09244 [Pyricularia pennisetigena]|uniref:uncharacterized protein n=1 Tax=Pyricularia pennisetigena TaxID=1578925 RepID=UPI00114DC035|nr:uncharacterized protein PpBr36_09244 [Pyricularia pennisetigena]TLS21821.1 hypothetical protein PpBr36_09244 [Pyricularia pennisetigena]